MAVETTAPPPEETGLLASVAPEEATPGYDALPEPSAESADVGPGTTDEVEAETDDTPGIPDDLIQLAAEYGLDTETFPTADSLQKAVSRLQTAEDRRLLELAQQWQQSQQQYAPQGQQPQQFGQQPQGFQPQGQQPQGQGPQPFDLDKLLPSEQYDEGVRGAFKALNDHYGQQFGAVQQFAQAMPVLQQMWERQQQIEQFIQEQDNARTWNEIDGYFESLDPEWESVFGKGPTAALPQNSPQQLARHRLAQQSFQLGQLDARVGRTFTPVKNLLGRGLSVAFSKESQTIQRKKLIKQAQGRNGAALAKPVSKAGKPATGSARAISASVEFDRKFLPGE